MLLLKIMSDNGETAIGPQRSGTLAEGEENANQNTGREDDPRAGRHL